MRDKVVLFIEATTFLLLLAIGIVWAMQPSGNFEPYFVVFSLVFVATEIFRRYFMPSGHKHKFTPAELVQHREKLRKIFEGEIFRCRHEKLRKDAIIRHVDRVDSYPNTDESKSGISPWFRVALVDTYHKGIMVVLNAASLYIHDGKYTNKKGNSTEEIRAYLIGKIPYEDIEVVNMDGDEYYYFPHIYCHFNHNNEPYEELVYCQEVDMNNGHVHYSELVSFSDVQKQSKEFAEKIA
ncbi:hypothetical protein V9N49_003482 [Vibrio cholerae]|nr:hypothetical protein [Vibrio cholerae]